jgi:PAS domain S-box-containing protein
MNSSETGKEAGELKPVQGSTDPERLTARLQKELSFRQTIENTIACGIAVVDDSGRQAYVNKAFCNMVGWSEEELLGKQAPFIYWHQQDIDNINTAFTKTFENKAPEEGFDLVFCHKSGRSVSVNVIISPLKQDDDKIYYLASVVDITQRKKTEAQLLKMQVLLVSSIESQKNSIIFFLDREYNYLYFNKAHRDAMKYAYNVDIEPGMNMVDCMSIPVDQKAAKENFDRALRGESFTYLNTFGTVNRDYYEVLVNPIVNDKNEIIGCTGLARNITERIGAEQALRDSEIKFKEIIDQINDVIIVFDEKGKVIIWNKGAEKIIGMKSEETLGKNIADILYQITPPAKRDKDSIDRSIENIVSLKSSDIFNQITDSEIITRGSDSLRNIQTTVFPIRLDGSHLFCKVIRDTTEVKRYEREILRISAEKDKFYSTIAQYLYTPFNVFKDFSKIMAEELDDLPIKEIHSMAMMMSKSANNLYSLLDNMLQWTKLNQGKIPYEPQKLDLRIISLDALSVLKPKAESKKIELNYFADDEIVVHADIYMLKTILRNLVAHSLNDTGSGGKIEIKAEMDSSEVYVSVLNNGPGINPKFLTKLFDISHLNSKQGEEDEKGTTLGLLLCREFVEKHGGKIWVESYGKKGNEYKFSLPAKKGIH